MARFGRLDDGEYPFFIKRTRSWQDVAGVLPDSLTMNRRKTKADRLKANVPISLSGTIGCRAESRDVFLLFFFSFPRFPCASATPDRIIWSLLSSPKEQNASDPIRPPSRSWYMIYAPLLLSCADRGYLLIVSLGKEREPLPHPSGPRLPSCRDCAPYVVSRTSCKLVTDIMNVRFARDPLFYKDRSHVNCFGGNKDTRYC